MAIQKFRNPYVDESQPSNFSSMLDRFFNESLNSRSSMAKFTPHVDTSETERDFEIEVQLPGIKKEDIQIEFHDGRLTISGERKFSEEKKTKKYHMLESQYGSFSRSFYLPDNINAENIEADYEDGVLRVIIPKDTRRVSRHQIQIKGSGKQSASKTETASKETSAKNQEKPKSGSK